MSSFLLRVGIPALFVVLWSTGWIAARAAAPFVDPMTFLAIRFGLAGILLAFFATAGGARWPRGAMQWRHGLASGLLLHAGYLGCVWWAVKNGLPAGISGLIAALQPLLTAAAAGPLAGEKLSTLQRTGIATGILGVALVLYPKLVGASSILSGQYALLIAVNVLGMVAVTAGTFYQKRYLKSGDLRTIAAVQYLGAIPPILLVAILSEEMRFEINWQSVGTLAWSVLALSIGATALMLMMIRQGAVSRVASLIYLVPPTVALQAWLLFGEMLIPIQFAGMAATALGVYLTTSETPPATT